MQRDCLSRRFSSNWHEYSAYATTLHILRQRIRERRASLARLDTQACEVRTNQHPGSRRPVIYGQDPEQKIDTVCHRCNNAWMSRIDDKRKARLESMLLNRPITIEPSGMKLLTEWAVLRAMVFESIKPRNDNEQFFPLLRTCDCMGRLNTLSPRLGFPCRDGGLPAPANRMARIKAACRQLRIIPDSNVNERLPCCRRTDLKSLYLRKRLAVVLY